MIRQRCRQFVATLLGSWLIVVGLVDLIRATMPYRAEILSVLAVTVGLMILLAR
jgi:hypothetical protein